MLGFRLFATDQSHEETLSLCASDLVKLFSATLLVHCVVHLEQVYIRVVRAFRTGTVPGTDAILVEFVSGGDHDNFPSRPELKVI